MLWTDPETGQVFTKPGPGRIPFTPSGAPPNEQSESQIQALRRDLEQLHQQLQKGGIQLGAVNFKLGGFIEMAGIYRTRNEVADVSSDYNQGIPFRISPLAHENETRFSARQSRLSLLTTGDVSPDTHLAAFQGGYIWRDAFSGVGGAPTTNIGIFMTSIRYYPYQ